jgi:GT2 family glycosyltransferase
VSDTDSTVPAVSIVMPTYNRSQYVVAAVEHLLNLKPPDGGFEIIVVDDGSKDDTATVLASQVDSGAIQLIRRANGGPAAARNTGIAASRGSIIALTDDDCQPAEDWLMQLLAVLESSSVAGVGGRTVPASVDSLVSRFVARRHVSELPASANGAVRWLVTCNAAFKREALLAVGGFDESYPVPGGEDTDLCARLISAGYTLGVAPDALVKHDHTWRSARHFAHTWYRYGRGDARHLRRDGQRLDAGRRLMADARYMTTVGRNFRADLSDGLGVRESVAFAALDTVRRMSKTVGLIVAYPRVSA